MPITPLAKNKGPLLISKVRGGVDDFPPEFISRIGKDIYAQEVPLDIEPDALTDFLLETRLIQERTNERKRVNTYFGGFGPNGDSDLTLEDILGISLVSEIVLPDGQIGTRTRTLVKEGSHLTANEFTVDGVQRNLGNGWLDQVYTTKPTVFPKNTFRAMRSEYVVPLEFRALLGEQEIGLVSAGTATMPTLGIGDIEKTDAQLDEFTHQTSVRSREDLVLPQTLTGSRTDRYKQVSDITKILELDTVTPALPTATRDVTFTKLGDGTAIEERVDTPVFEGKVASTEIPDLVPDVFKGSVPSHVLERTIIGTVVDPPVLSAGDFEKTESQVDLFTKRVRTRGRAGLTLPIVANIKKLGGDKFGGEIMQVVLTLDDVQPVVESGLGVTESESKPIGGGLFLRTTEKWDIATVWPLLSSRLWDEVMQVEYDETRQVVAAGTAESPNPGGIFGWRSEVRALDKWRSIRINTSKSAPAYVDVASALVSFEMKPFKFPGFIPSGFAPSVWNIRQASARIVQHTIKTWWINSSNPPASPAYNEIVTDTAVVGNLEGTGWTSVNDVLHDDYGIGLNWFSATTPSAFQYCGQFLITGTCDFTLGSTSVLGHGTLFTTELVPGDLLGPYAIGSIASDTALTLTTPFPYSGFTGATVVATRTSARWIGTLKVIGASVTPEKEKNVWKVQTESVIMR